MADKQTDLDWAEARTAELREGGMSLALAAQTARREALARSYAQWNRSA